MDNFSGRIAIVTGGGSGIGRELARQLVAKGCHVAICDVSEASMAETERLCFEEKSSEGVRLTKHVVDVSVESDLTSVSR